MNDTAYVLQSMLFCLAGVMAFQSARAGLKNFLGLAMFWSILAALELVALGLGWQSPPALAAQLLVVGGPYAVLVYLQRGIDRALMRMNSHHAIALARFRARVMPFRAFHKQVLLLQAMEDARSRAEGGADLAETLRSLADQLGLEALDDQATLVTLQTRFARRDWPGLVTALQESPPLRSPLAQGASRAMLVRALCEVGKPQEALTALDGLHRLGQWAALRRHLHQAWLALLTVGGRQAAVSVLLEGQLSRLDPLAAELWKARADWHAGDPVRARARLAVIQQLPRVPKALQPVLEERQAQLEQPPPPLPEGVQASLVLLERTVVVEDRLFGAPRRLLREPSVVGTLFVTLLAGYLGTSILSDPAGAFEQYAAIGLLLKQEPWRLGTALLLHAGVLHLGLNGLSLLLLGSMVEGLFGRRATLLIFGVSGLLANLCAVTWRPEVLLVGASGAILGLAGGLVAFFVRARGYLPPAWRKGLLRIAAVLLTLEGVAGWVLPEVSLTAHVCGVTVGFLLALVLPLKGLERGMSSLHVAVTSAEVAGS